MGCCYWFVIWLEEDLLLLMLVKLIHFQSLNINKDLLEKLLRVCKYHKYENK